MKSFIESDLQDPKDFRDFIPGVAAIQDLRARVVPGGAECYHGEENS